MYTHRDTQTHTHTWHWTPDTIQEEHRPLRRERVRRRAYLLGYSSFGKFGAQPLPATAQIQRQIQNGHLLAVSDTGEMTAPDPRHGTRRETRKAVEVAARFRRGRTKAAKTNPLRTTRRPSAASPHEVPCQARSDLGAAHVPFAAQTAARCRSPVPSPHNQCRPDRSLRWPCARSPAPTGDSRATPASNRQPVSPAAANHQVEERFEGPGAYLQRTVRKGAEILHCQVTWQLVVSGRCFETLVVQTGGDLVGFVAPAGELRATQRESPASRTSQSSPSQQHD